jgi:hypothetical protein
LYQDGFPIGYKNKEKDYILYNHFDIILQVHKPDTSEDSYRIVGALVEPVSIDYPEVKKGEESPECVTNMNPEHLKATKNLDEEHMQQKTYMHPT